MNDTIKVLKIDAASSFYKVKRYIIGDYFGPVDLGLHLSRHYNSLNIGTGLLAGSIFPGSNRLIFTGNSPCWGGFYISSMGGAGLVFNNCGIDMLSITGKAAAPSVLYLNRIHGEELQVDMLPLDVSRIWQSGRKGIYALMDYVNNEYSELYKESPRILVTGPASLKSDIGAIASVPVFRGELSFVDTWAGRGGFGSKLLQQHGIAAIIYGGTHIDEDFRNRKVADQWFEERYNKRLVVKDMEATTKYRFNEEFQTGGTFGVNYQTLAGRMISFNYQSIYMSEEERLDIHKRFILDHYLKQFNEETIKTKQFKTCGEPCTAVCKKMNNEFKKDYEPYQTMGPLSGIFDQRAAEKINHYADMLGFDAISVGGFIVWIMECLSKEQLSLEEAGVSKKPKFQVDGFDVVNDSNHNAEIGIEILDAIISEKGEMNLSKGARRLARYLAEKHGIEIKDSFVYAAFARNGWMVPNQYWTPGVLSPMAIMGKYYMYYGKDFVSPRELGRKDAERLVNELVLDNLGMCRFHRGWAEEMLPEVVEKLWNKKDEFMHKIKKAAIRINSRNSSIYWETERNLDFIYEFLKRKKYVDKDENKELQDWLDFFEKNKKEAGLSFWYEIHKGISESLKEFL